MVSTVSHLPVKLFIHSNMNYLLAHICLSVHSQIELVQVFFIILYHSTPNVHVMRTYLMNSGFPRWLESDCSKYGKVSQWEPRVLHQNSPGLLCVELSISHSVLRGHGYKIYQNHLYACVQDPGFDSQHWKKKQTNNLYRLPTFQTPTIKAIWKYQYLSHFRWNFRGNKPWNHYFFLVTV